MECRLSRDITIDYEACGEGIPLFALHGWPLDHQSEMLWMEPHFVERRGWRRIYPDLPGMGKTKAADWIVNHDQMLEIVLEFIEAIAPGERFVVEGHSYGAALSGGVVVKKGNRVAGVFLNAPPNPLRQEEDLPKQTVVHEDPDFLAALRPDEQDLRNLFVTQSLAALQDIRSIAPTGNDTAFLARMEGSQPFSYVADLPDRTFTMPALIVAGRQDSWVGYRHTFAVAERFSRATCAVLDGAGHAVASERKRLHQALVSDWLDRVEDYIKTAHRPQSG